MYITEKQVEEVLGYDLALESVKQAHLDLSSGLAMDVPRVRARSNTMSLHSLSASSNPLGYSAIKVYSATRNGVNSHLHLYENETGALKATIEANQLGRRRTASASTLGYLSMHSSPPETAGVIGLGFQGMGAIRSLAALENPPKKIFLYRRNKDKLEKDAEFVSSECRVEGIACESIEELLEKSAVVVTATTSSKEFIEDPSLLTHVRHISAIGSNALSRRELSPRVVTGARKVVVDSFNTAQNEAGDLLSPIENGKLYWNQVTELGDELAKEEKETGAGYTIFCSQGVAAQDLYCGVRVLKELERV